MKTSYMLWLLPLLLCGCGKSQPAATTTTSTVAFTFTTKYDSVITMIPNSTFYFSFDVNTLTGDISTDPLNCSMTGLPGNAAVAPSQMTVTKLLGGLFNFTVGNVPIGSYAIQFVVASKAYGTQTHKLLLKIVAPPDNAPLLAGSYPGSFDFCAPDSFFHYLSTVTTVFGIPYEIKISNIKNLGSGLWVNAWVSDVVKIPLQSIGGYTIWGSGTFSKDTGTFYEMAISDTLARGADTETCTIHIQH